MRRSITRDRLRWWRKIFQAGPQDLGITELGQIVSVDVFIKGKEPTQESVDEFLSSAGLEAVRQEFWLWKKSYLDDQFEIWIGDARKDNFVETAAGIVPIDIRIWSTSLDTMTT